MHLSPRCPPKQVYGPDRVDMEPRSGHGAALAQINPWGYYGSGGQPRELGATYGLMYLGYLLEDGTSIIFSICGRARDIECYSARLSATYLSRAE